MAFAATFVSGIDDNQAIKNELAAALTALRGARSFSVADLVNPRRAYFQHSPAAAAPVPPGSGDSGFRDLFGREVPTDQFVEQFVAFHGVLGRVDVYQETPTDIRTTASMPGDVLAERRDYVDQLGMYCAMTGVPRGRLIVYRRATGERAAALKVFDVRYRDLGAIEGAMIASRDTLCGAIDGADPTALPRCDRTADGCEYRGQCGCDAARAAERVVAPDAVRLKENTELAAMLGAHAVQHALAAPRVPRIGDLVSVQAAGADASDDDETDVSTIEGRLAELERQGFWGALTRAMHFGVPGAFTRQYVELRALAGWVGLYKDVPTLLRATDAGELVHRRTLVPRFGEYFDRLAFACALAGRDKGRVVLHYPRVADDAFMVYDVWLRDLEVIRAEAGRRIRRLSG